ncbi:MAG: tRNA (cytidine(34)-2'-O)-methyltransferase [Aeromicrobium sp.]|uniref:tRNA (cytidine(34)-2'-O)-methyltransferase n=1 Tax=Aeromicrobium sp. TaxID=1871063 RepID=UPI0025BFCF44|nr:tRNA (cytidine(34)-2'-O)-methyltransferase [Aeromicrobium sp.]MCK5892681.1 tRNA (cytidine(34)-2'-O)-methyltransferase [Aeromicrobium sp.]MDF1703658.1 tRNA (cytidine(34)-2'-O)-methyltransferase [Aeromicrobium sp.]
MFQICFVEPRIAGNTGSAIRLAAATGAHLHLVDPLFDLEDSKLRRAGLDYHDLAVVTVHETLDAAYAAFDGGRVLAYTTSASRRHTDVAYEPGDVLMFGSEPTGLPEEVQHDPRVHDRLRIPMLESRRSMNLANCASIAVYEAWRQHGFPGAV